MQTWTAITNYTLFPLGRMKFSGSYNLGGGGIAKLIITSQSLQRSTLESSRQLKIIKRKKKQTIQNYLLGEYPVTCATIRALTPTPSTGISHQQHLSPLFCPSFPHLLISRGWEPLLSPTGTSGCLHPNILFTLSRTRLWRKSTTQTALQSFIIHRIQPTSCTWASPLGLLRGSLRPIRSLMPSLGDGRFTYEVDAAELRILILRLLPRWII